MKHPLQPNPFPMDISDEDVLEAMKSINGYLDITPEDFKAIYIVAFRQAVERLSRSFAARDIMTEEVISVGIETSLVEAAELMTANNISGCPVLDVSHHVVGVISEKDFLYEMGDADDRTFMGVVARCLKNKGCAAISMRKQKVGDIMTSPPITVDEDKRVSEIAALFEAHDINRVPVVRENLDLVGIIARSDIVQSFCRNIQRETADK